MIVVGVDPGNRKLGVANVAGPQTLEIPKLEKGATATDRARRLSQIRRRVDEALGLERLTILSKIGLAVVEGYSLGGARGYAAAYGGEAGGVIRAQLFERGFEILEVAPTRLKKYATGDGNAKKPQMIAAARAELGHDLGEDAADAYWLFRLGVHGTGTGPAPTGLELIRREIVRAIDWPDAGQHEARDTQ